jgi:TolB protein
MKALGLIVALCALGTGCGSADGDRITVAVVPFRIAGTAPPVDVAEVIRADLASSGRFAPMPIADMPAHPTRTAEIRFEDWRSADADYVVVGTVARVHDGGHEVEFHLVDTRTGKPVVAYLVPSAPDALERTALEIAGMIERRI